MRRFGRLGLTLASLAMLLGITGCALLDNLMPSVTIPVPLPDAQLENANGGFISEDVDVRADANWMKYGAHISKFETVSVAAKATNGTASPVSAQFFMSDTKTLTALTFDAAVAAGTAKLICSLEIPASAAETVISSTALAISGELEGIVSDGQFTVYAVSDPSTVTLSFTHCVANLVVKARI